MAKITIGKTLVTVIPSKWEHIKKNDLLKLVELALVRETGIEVKMEFFLYLAKMTREFMPNSDNVILSKGNTDYYISRESFLDMVNTLDWIFKEVGNKVVINSRLRKQLIPFFYLSNIRYLGPGDGLTNISFSEFIESEKHYVNYLKNQDIKHLNRLIATLYRPMDKTLSQPKKIKFELDSVPLRSIIIHHLDAATKFSILVFYEGCRQFIMETFEQVYSGTSNGTPDKFGMASVIEALTNNDPTKFEAVEETKLFNVLLSLEKQMDRADEMKRKMEKK